MPGRENERELKAATNHQLHIIATEYEHLETFRAETATNSYVS